MNYTMENAWRYLPKPCSAIDRHDPDSGCYDCVRALRSKEQGTTTIAKALIDEGWPAFVEEVGESKLAAVVHGSYGKAIGCTTEFGLIFYESFYESGGIHLNDPLEFRPSYYGCTSETLAIIMETFDKNAWRLKMGADLPMLIGEE